MRKAALNRPEKTKKVIDAAAAETNELAVTRSGGSLYELSAKGLSVLGSWPFKASGEWPRIAAIRSGGRSSSADSVPPV